MAKRRPRGSGSTFKEGSVWSLRIQGKRPTYETGLRSRAEAENRLALIRNERMQGRLGAAADPRFTPTLAVLAVPWLARRAETHAAGLEDGYRWRKHLLPYFGHLRPDDVETAALRAFVEVKVGEIAPASVRVVMAILSSLFEDLVERGVARMNPCRHMPKSLLRLMRPTHNPKQTPFLFRLEDVKRVHRALREVHPTLAVGYALGVFAGLRTGEAFALRWPSVDLLGRRMVVSESVKGQVKDRDPRPVPIVNALAAVLQEARLAAPDPHGLVCPALRVDGAHVDKHTPGRAIVTVLRDLGLARPGFGLELAPGAGIPHQKLWYWCTRHTFASHWAMSGRSLRELQEILGHSSIAVTERYAHLQPGYWSPNTHALFDVELLGAPAVVSRLPGSVEQDKAETAGTTRRTKRKH